MLDTSFYSHVALGLAALFGGIGVLHLVGPRWLRAAYQRWDYPQRLRLIVGAMEIVSAAWLANPSLRGWGIGLAVFISFGAVVTLLNHRSYLHAVPGMLMLAALVPAAASLPHTARSVGYAPSLESVSPVLGAYAADEGAIAQGVGG